MLSLIICFNYFRLANGFPFIEAEILYGVRHEYAQNVVDVLGRRMRLAYLHRDIALQVYIFNIFWFFILERPKSN